MVKELAISTVKSKLNITDSSRDLIIGDIYDNSVIYMNLDELPNALEPFIRNKVKRIIDYEAQVGEGQALDIASQTEGKCSWTFNISENSGREAIYGFSASDFAQLKRFRKVRK